MGNGYTRNDTADNIADGNVINASDLDGEFDAVQAAFDNSTGHTHDGTDGEGAPIDRVGPAQDIVVTSTVLRPKTNNTVDLGVETTNEFKNLYIDGTAYLDSVDIDGGSITGLTELTVDNLSLNGNTITTTDTNGNLNLRANGTGVISVNNTDVTFGDNDKAVFGVGSDLQIYHSGTGSYISDQGTGPLNLLSGGVRLKDTTDTTTMLAANAGGSVILYHDNAVKLTTKATGIDVTGDVEASNDLNLTSDSAKITFGADSEVELYHTHNSGLTLSHTGTGDDVVTALAIRSNQGTLTSDETLGRFDFTSNTLAGGVGSGVQSRINVRATDTYSATVAGSRMEFLTSKPDGTLSRSLYIDEEQNIRLDDNRKAVFGTGSDLQIYHQTTGTVGSYIAENGSGDLRISGNNLWLNDASGNTYFRAVNGSYAKIYYAGAEKLATSSAGVDVTGKLTATNGTAGEPALYVDGAGNAGWGLEINSHNAPTASDLVLNGNAVLGTGTNLSQTMPTGGYYRWMTGATSNTSGTAGATEVVRITSSGDVGIGTSSPDKMLHVSGGNALLQNATGNTAIAIVASNNVTDAGNKIAFFAAGRFDEDEEMAYIKPLLTSNNGGAGNVQLGHLTFGTSGEERLRINSGGNVGIGETNPSQPLHITDTGAYVQLEDSDGVLGGSMSSAVRLYAGANEHGQMGFLGTSAGNMVLNNKQGNLLIGADTNNAHANSVIQFSVDNSEAMRITAAGDFLVNKTTSDPTTDGFFFNESGNRINSQATNNLPMDIRRAGTEGSIASFRSGNTLVFKIVVDGADGCIDGASNHAGIKLGQTSLIPRRGGVDINNVIDLGNTTFRFDDIYATNGTINTSDANEKQDVADLTATEMLVAARISSLFKTFRWIDSVADKGDNARTHTGVMAQDVQAAFTAEGLDAGDYALFTSATWWEHSVDVDAVEADEEDGINQRDAGVRIDVYETEAEAPEGSVEVTRMGIRYTELLAFVSAYNDQRFATIEARLAALEAV